MGTLGALQHQRRRVGVGIKINTKVFFIRCLLEKHSYKSNKFTSTRMLFSIEYV